MAANPLQSMGLWRGFEGAVEIAVPMTVAGIVFFRIKGLMEQVSMGRPLTTLEVFVLLGAMTAVISWAVSRQMFLSGRRKPIVIAVMATIFSCGAVYGLVKLLASGFEASCADVFEGVLIQIDGVWKGQTGLACQVGSIAGNNYIPGALIRPAWDGQASGLLWVYMTVVATFSSVAMRDVRVRPTKIVKKLYKLLEFAPASGLDGVLGEKAKDGRVQACSNSTFWGEICGQLYSADKKFEPGEWCGRCNQTYTKADFNLTFNIVTLFSDNIDLLNMLEKKDTLSWDVPGRIPADGRQSGVERWVVVGQVTVPDVISVSQLLSITHAQLDNWQSDNERVQSAIELAKKRASKLYGWIWFGRQTKRLTYARPTNKVLMAVGTTRLRDLVTDSGDELYLQLDIGLLPLEMRTAFYKTFRDEKRSARYQNSKSDIWVPIAPRLSAELAGMWVPRVEGEALRKWLATGRLQEEGKRGVTIPVPYTVFDAPEEEEIQAVIDQNIQQLVEEDVAPVERPTEQIDLTDIFDFGQEDTPVPEETQEEESAPLAEEEPEPTVEIMTAEPQFVPEIYIEPGTLDIVRVPYNRGMTEPDLHAKRIGASISEWEWLEPEQIQMMRQQVLVLVDSTKIK